MTKTTLRADRQIAEKWKNDKRLQISTMKHFLLFEEFYCLIVIKNFYAIQLYFLNLWQ